MLRTRSMRRSLMQLALAFAACVPAPASETAPPVPERDALAGIWIGADELAELPTQGPAWDNLVAAAEKTLAPPNLSDQDDLVDVQVLAKALVFARTGEERYRDEVVAACTAAIGTERGGDCLALGRNLAAYVLAADLVVLPPDHDERFRAWLRTITTANHGGRTLRSTHEDRPNNWGTHAGGSRAVVARYLGDTDELARVAYVFRGWLGDRRAYTGFEYREPWWQADESKPVGINPKGSTKEGFRLDGVLPDDQRRGGPLAFPPHKENYVYEALQGALLQAVVLDRAGYDVWDWEDRALLRAFEWLHEMADFPAEGDDTWQPHLVNRVYGTDFPAPVPARPGKNVGWTDWTCGEPGTGR